MEVNVTDWPVVGDEALGTKPKRWLMDPRTGNRWLLLDDEKRSHQLRTRDSGTTPEAYADRARSPFEGSPHPVDVAIEALATIDLRARLLWLSRCKDVDGLVEPIRMIPAGRMSVSARELAERVLRRNCYRLLY